MPRGTITSWVINARHLCYRIYLFLSQAFAIVSARIYRQRLFQILFSFAPKSSASRSHKMNPSSKHAEHDYIVARQERYVEAWRTGSPERIMEFMDKNDFNFSDFSTQQENLSHSVVKDLFADTFTQFHDLKVKTRSLHGHKHFTAWEWSVTCKAARGPDGQRLSKEEAPPKKTVGCTLMWWNDQDKIIRNHEYIQVHHEISSPER